MLFIFVTSFPANSRPLLHMTSDRWRKFPQENIFKKLVAELFRQKTIRPMCEDEVGFSEKQSCCSGSA
jgi:hypothetical protein